jgi:hypothetical protein
LRKRPTRFIAGFAARASRSRSFHSSGDARYNSLRTESRAEGLAVAFKFGALADQVGVCQWTRRERVSVLLNFLGSSRTVLAPRDWLRVVTA